MAAPEKQDDLQSVLRLNAELVETVEQLQKVNQQLREELNLYRRKLQGQSSKRHVEDDSQLHWFKAGEQTSEGDDEPDNFVAAILEHLRSNLDSFPHFVAIKMSRFHWPSSRTPIVLILAFALQSLPSRCPAQAAKPLIFDTDIDTDCDDVGAVACLHSLAGRGEIEILATTVSSNFEYSAPCLDALNRYYGRPDLPVGAVKRQGASTHRGSRYAKQIAAQYPSRFATNDDAPSAVDVLRQALADADDASVSIVTVGYLTNMADLLRSPADAISSAHGRELVKQKVASLVVMGGRYPEHLDPGEFGNLKPDPQSALYVAGNWPGAIYFSGDGEKVGTGSRRGELPTTHPMRVAYDLFLDGRPTRSSWDQTALLFAVRPDAEYWKVTAEGGNQIFPNGTNRWTDDDPGDHRLVQLRDGYRQNLTDQIERLMMRQDAKQQLAGITPDEQVTYKSIDDVDLKLNIFQPLGDTAGQRAAIIFFFGGGWNSGSVQQFYPHCRHLASQGMVAIAADYRVASRHQVQAKSCVEDAKSAIRFVRENARRWNVDPNRIAAGGGSAGGHLAAATATLPGFEDSDASPSSRPDLLVLFNPALVLAAIPDQFAMPDDKAKGLGQRVGIELEKFSPYHNVGKELPPTIIFHGDADTTVAIETARLFQSKAKELGTTCELINHEGEGHGFFNFTRGDGSNYAETLEKMDAFLGRHEYFP